MVNCAAATRYESGESQGVTGPSVAAPVPAGSPPQESISSGSDQGISGSAACAVGLPVTGPGGCALSAGEKQCSSVSLTGIAKSPVLAANPVETLLNTIEIGQRGQPATDRQHSEHLNPETPPPPVQTPARGVPERSIEDMLSNIQERARINRQAYAINRRQREARLPHAD